MTIHQLYVTHCTYGGSALEQAVGEQASRHLGYSVRAGSPASKDELRKQFRAVERYQYYYLPSDTPVERCASLSARECPRRLVFIPSVSGSRLLQLTSYRSHDVVGRVGSYFSHVLVQDQREGPEWSALDCLKLLGSDRWRLEDGDDLRFTLPVAAPLTENGDADHAPINEHLLRCFLLGPGSDGANDLDFLPPRWRDMPLERRQSLFGAVWRGFFASQKMSRASLVILAEPEVAALMFFGVFSLLPDNKLRRQFGFSTFEKTADHVCTPLAGIAFENPATDLPPDAYRRHFVVNTYAENKQSAPATSDLGFAEGILNVLFSQGFSAVEAIRRRLEAASAQDVNSLNALWAAEVAVHGLLESAATSTQAALKLTDLQLSYIARRLRDNIGLPLSSEWRRRFEQTPAKAGELAVTVAKLPERNEESLALINELVSFLNDRDRAGLFRGDLLPTECRRIILREFLEKTHSLPEGCETWWSELSKRGSPAAEILAPLVAELSLDSIRLIAKKLTRPTDQIALFSAVYRMDRKDERKEQWLANKTAGMEDKEFAYLVDGLRVELRTGPLRERISERLGLQADSLCESPERFKEGFDFLAANVGLLRDEEHVEQVRGWDELRRMISNAAQMQAQAPPPTGIAKWLGGDSAPGFDADALGQQVAERLKRLAPPETRHCTVEEAAAAMALFDALKCRLTLPANPFASDFRAKLQSYLRTGYWSSPTPYRKVKSTGLEAWMEPKTVMIAAFGLALLLAALIVVPPWLSRSKKVANESPAKVVASAPPKVDPAKPAPSPVTPPKIEPPPLVLPSKIPSPPEIPFEPPPPEPPASTPVTPEPPVPTPSPPESSTKIVTTPVSPTPNIVEPANPRPKPPTPPQPRKLFAEAVTFKRDFKKPSRKYVFDTASEIEVSLIKAYVFETFSDKTAEVFDFNRGDSSSVFVCKKDDPTEAGTISVQVRNDITIDITGKLARKLSDKVVLIEIRPAMGDSEFLTLNKPSQDEIYFNKLDVRFDILDTFVIKESEPPLFIKTCRIKRNTGQPVTEEYPLSSESGFAELDNGLVLAKLKETVEGSSDLKLVREEYKKVLTDSKSNVKTTIIVPILVIRPREQKKWTTEFDSISFDAFRVLPCDGVNVYVQVTAVVPFN